MSSFRLLIIDDEASIRDGLKRALSLDMPEVTVLTAEDGNVGLQRAQLEYPDLILLDIAMPVMTGIEVLNQMLFLKMTTPVIVMTAFGSETNQGMVKLCARNEHIKILHKPVDIDELFALIRRDYTKLH